MKVISGNLFKLLGVNGLGKRQKLMPPLWALLFRFSRINFVVFTMATLILSVPTRAENMTKNGPLFMYTTSTFTGGFVDYKILKSNNNYIVRMSYQDNKDSSRAIYFDLSDKSIIGQVNFKLFNFSSLNKYERENFDGFESVNRLISKFNKRGMRTRYKEYWFDYQLSGKCASPFDSWFSFSKGEQVNKKRSILLRGDFKHSANSECNRMSGASSVPVSVLSLGINGIWPLDNSRVFVGFFENPTFLVLDLDDLAGDLLIRPSKHTREVDYDELTTTWRTDETYEIWSLKPENERTSYHTIAAKKVEEEFF